MAYEKLNLQGRVAVVVGGTTGIGRALSLGLAQAGATVVASARRADQVESVAAELETIGSRTLRATSDVGSKASLEKLLEVTLARFDKVDILVNCAGFTKRGASVDFAESDWNAILDTKIGEHTSELQSQSNLV